jgi:hypothetical protein
VNIIDLTWARLALFRFHHFSEGLKNTHWFCFVFIILESLDLLIEYKRCDGDALFLLFISASMVQGCIL